MCSAWNLSLCLSVSLQAGATGITTAAGTLVLSEWTPLQPDDCTAAKGSRHTDAPEKAASGGQMAASRGGGGREGHGELCRTSQEALTPVLPEFFQKPEEQGALPNSFSKANFILIANQARATHTHRENCGRIERYEEHKCKTPKRNTSKSNAAQH